MNEEDKEWTQGIYDCMVTIIRERFSNRLVFCIEILFFRKSFFRRFRREFRKLMKEQ